MTQTKRKRRELLHAGKHPITRRHRDALLAIAKNKGPLSDARLRRAIGAYATNVITSLEHDRRLIAHQTALEGIGEGGWILTERGRQVVQELADELASTSTASFA